MATHTDANRMVDPYMLFEKVHLREGMHVADLGCSRTGHIVFPAAKVVGARGIVYAVHVLKDILTIIKKRAASEHMLNVHPVWADIEWVGKTAIPSKSLDVAFLVNTLVHADNRHGTLEEANRLLKEKARMVIVDWGEHGLPFGPSDDRYVDFDNIRQWAIEHGFGIQETFKVGQFHTGMVLFKHD